MANSPYGPMRSRTRRHASRHSPNGSPFSFSPLSPDAFVALACPTFIGCAAPTEDPVSVACAGSAAASPSFFLESASRCAGSGALVVPAPSCEGGDGDAGTLVDGGERRASPDVARAEGAETAGADVRGASGGAPPASQDSIGFKCFKWPMRTTAISRSVRAWDECRMRVTVWSSTCRAARTPESPYVWASRSMAGVTSLPVCHRKSDLAPVATNMASRKQPASCSASCPGSMPRASDRSRISRAAGVSQVASWSRSSAR